MATYIPRKGQRGRPKGSRNGYSINPNYTPVGTPANYKEINGQRVYESAVSNGIQNILGRDVLADKRRNEAQVQRGIEAGRQRARRAELTRNIQAAAEADRATRRAELTRNIQAAAERDRANSGIRGFAKRAANALGGVAGNVGKAFASAGGNIRNTMKRTGDTVGNWLNERRKDLGNLWDGSAGAGTGRDEAERLNARADVKGRLAAGNMKAGRTDRYRELARESISDRAEADRRQNAYDKSIVGRMERARNDIGNWLGDRRRDIEGATNRARNAVGDAARNARKAAGNLWDGNAGAGTGRDEAERLNARADVKGRLASGNMKAGRTGRYRELARESISNRAEADRKQQAYDRSIVGRAEKIGKNISKAANDASTFLNDRVGDARSALNTAKTEATKHINNIRYNINMLGKKDQKKANDLIANINAASTPAEVQSAERELDNLMSSVLKKNNR